ncbi:hypothetical protein ABZ920_01665 [Streptomyces sp. NPDC046831]|uniref:hypothetical protein n=1 Tax=Streptomyces sp. NPDC046831 TaxID=3154805 RepID=UPI0033FD74FA
MFAQQLSLSVRTPGELVTKVAEDPRRTVIVLPELHSAAGPAAVGELIGELLHLKHVRLVVEDRRGRASDIAHLHAAVMDLDQPQWIDPQRHTAWLAERQPTIPKRRRIAPAPVIHLDDAAAVCGADPWHTTASFERAQDTHRGLRAAWLRAGAALIRDQTPADRALTLRAMLGEDADPRLPAELDALADTTDWQIAWTRVRGDTTPPWPGPVRALACGRGRSLGAVLVADHQDTVRLVMEADATALGRLPGPVHAPRDLAVRPDGTALVLDAQGRLHVHAHLTGQGPTGLAALLHDGSTLEDELLDAVAGRLRAMPGTAIASGTRPVAVGDATGQVHVFSQQYAPRSVPLHDGPVTALAALEVREFGEPAALTLFYSGGADGRVRVWRQDSEPLPDPVAERPGAVTALAAEHVEHGPALAIAWSDGLVEHRCLATGRVRTFRPGGPVAALALTSTGQLLVGTDHALVCLAPRRSRGPDRRIVTDGP